MTATIKNRIAKMNENLFNVCGNLTELSLSGKKQFTISFPIQEQEIFNAIENETTINNDPYLQSAELIRNYFGKNRTEIVHDDDCGTFIYLSLC